MGEQGTGLLPAQAVAGTFHIRASSVLSPGDELFIEAFPAGSTLEEAVLSFSVPQEARQGILFTIGGVDVPEEQWRILRPAAGTLVELRVVPMGNALFENMPKDTLRLVGGVIAMAGAAAIGGGATLTTAVLGLAGIWAVNQLVGLPPEPDDPDRSNITGIRNRLIQYKPVPMIFGRMKVFPPLAALPYTQTEDDSQFIRVLFLLGYGELALDESSLKLGDQSFVDFEDIEYTFLPGHATNDPYNPFTDSVYEDTFSDPLKRAPEDIELTTSFLDADGEQNPEVVVRTSAIDAVELEVQITFNAGLYVVNEREPRSAYVDLSLQYRLEGEGETQWLPVENNNQVSTATLSETTTTDNLWDIISDIDDAIVDELVLLNAVALADRKAQSYFMGRIRATALASWTQQQLLNIAWSSWPDIQTSIVALMGQPETDVDTVLGHTVTYTPVATEAEGDATYMATLQRLAKHIDLLDLVVKVLIVRDSNNAAHVGSETEPFTTFFIQFAGYQQWRLHVQSVVPIGEVVHRVSAANASIVRRSIRWQVNAPGQYKVRIRRITADHDDSGGNGSIRTVSHFTHLRSWRDVDPVVMPGVAMLALKAKATDKLSGALDSFNCVVTRKLPTWNGSSWTAAVATRNPAWAMVEVLAGAGNKRAEASGGVPINMDTTTIKALADWCDSNDYYFDYLFLRAETVQRALKKVLDVARASYTVRDGQHSVIHDDTQVVPRQLISEENSWNFSGEKIFEQTPLGLKVQYVNADADWKLDELIVWADGYSSGNPAADENISKVQLIGVVDSPDTDSDFHSGQVYKLGRYMLAATQLRPERFTVNMDWEHLILQRGDLAWLQHQFIQVGLGAGRVVAITGSLGARTAITVDKLTTLPAGSTYAAVIRTAKLDGFHEPGIAVNASESDVLTFTASLDDTSDAIAVGDLVVWGVTALEKLEVLVQSIRPGKQLSASVTMVPYNAAIYLADTEEIPDYDPKITTSQDPEILYPPAPVIVSILSDESVLQRGHNGSLISNIAISLGFPTFASANDAQAILNVDGVEVQYRLSLTVEAPANADGSDGALVVDNDWIRLPAFTSNVSRVIVPNVTDGAAYDVRARYISSGALAGAWVDIEAHVVVGKTTLPPDVSVLLTEADLKVLRWRYQTEPLDLAGFKVRYTFNLTGTWESAQKAHEGLITTTQFDITDFRTAESKRFMVKAVDVAGNESANMAAVTVAYGEDVTGVALRSALEEDCFWTGIKRQCTIDGSNNLVADAPVDPLFWGGDNDQFWGEDADDFWDGQYAELQYEFEVQPVASDIPSDIRLKIAFQGDARIEVWRPLNPAIWPAYPFSGEDFWVFDLTQRLWNDGGGGWVPFQGSIPAEVTGHKFKVTIPAGTTQAKITSLEVIYDAPVVEEVLDDVAIVVTTGTRLVLTKAYRQILSIELTVQQTGGNTAITALAVDKFGITGDGYTGPLIKAYDAAGAVVAANVDARVRGH